MLPIMDGFAKYLSADLPVLQITWARSNLPISLFPRIISSVWQKTWHFNVFYDYLTRGLVCENVVPVGGGKFHRDTISKNNQKYKTGGSPSKKKGHIINGPVRGGNVRLGL